ncbi:uncharacterized protein ASPGLDRAFT_51885 [Aspergillus glaucus CBS 516.65]|uniref:Uncharacterized protein n=1 Tax=Aspergillus glaucus CBS 516.65 TaxID=1160497 RepID=A0A1L9V7R7_ASPGL|nr:hypothetical protein ASPGLDRAFT_51885 [Aspergillus glaucus CBS 516.65]OJJ79974.1 hypothetical protein ASPGLDRAFT_51885 [Aspergillus glaucus CBS 516.65]
MFAGRIGGQKRGGAVKPPRIWESGGRGGDFAGKPYSGGSVARFAVDLRDSSLFMRS